MNPTTVRQFEAAVATWCDWMFSMSWQVAALVCVLTLLCWLLRNHSARLRYALWLLVPLRLALPPSLAFVTGWSWWLLPPVPTPVPSPTRQIAVATETPPQSHLSAMEPIEGPVVLQLDQNFAVPLRLETVPIPDGRTAVLEVERPTPSRSWLLIAWAAMASVQLVRLMIGVIAARRLVARSLPIGDTELQAEVDRLRWDLGIRQSIEVRTLPGSQVPMVVGLFKSCVILPDQIAVRLDTEELQAVLMHELQHVVRRDALVNMAQAVMGAFYFFHPAVWWADRQLNQLREDACDEATVAALCGRRRAYCAGMVKIAERLVEPKPRLALGVAESGLQVKRRLERILDPRLPIGLRLRWTDWLVVLFTAAVLLPAAAQPARSTVEAIRGPESTPQQVEESVENAASSANANRQLDPRLSNEQRQLATLVNPINSESKANVRSVTVSGLVVGPDGKAIEGAEITIWWYFGHDGFYRDWRPPVIKSQSPRFGAISGGDGQFKFTFTEKDVDENPMNIWGWPGRHALIVAAAEGYGPAWVSLEDRDKANFTFKLAKGDVPVQGRVVDLEGHPVEGATVDVERVTIGGNVHGSLWQTTWAGLSKGVKTDADGCFSLNGVGPGRTVVLHIDGPTIEHKVVSVETPANDQLEDAKPTTVEVVAGPTKPFEGVIRAKGTGQPLAGVVVCGESWSVSNEEDRYHRRVRATTDAQGHYRLLGLPKYVRYKLSVNPPRDLGFLPTIGKIADTEGLDPITMNFELRRGVPVRCRFIDKVTRQPVFGGELHYMPVATNPHYADVDEGGMIPNREYSVFYASDGEGYYRFVAWPGLGMLGIMPQMVRDQYLPTPMSSADKERAGGAMNLAFWPLMRGCQLIEPRETDSLLDLTIELDPGQSISGSLIGPDSKPVPGATAYALNYNHSNRSVMGYGPKDETRTLDTDTFTALRLEPRMPRTISFVHHDRKFIGSVVVDGDQQGSLTVRLEQWGAISGRLVDSKGRLLKDVQVVPRYPTLPEPGIVPVVKECKSDETGSFRIEGLLPRCELELKLIGRDKTQTLFTADALKQLVLEPGEVKEVGQIGVLILEAVFTDELAGVK